MKPPPALSALFYSDVISVILIPPPDPSKA